MAGRRESIPHWNINPSAIEPPVASRLPRSVARSQARPLAKSWGRSRIENGHCLLRGQCYIPTLVPPLVLVPVLAPEPAFVPELDVVFKSIRP